MSLINYVEPVNAGVIFLGIGGLLFFGVISWLFYKFARPMICWIEGLYRHDQKYWIVEEKMLDMIAKEKGIDLDAELLKREVIQKKNKSFRKKIEEEVFKKMFPKEEEKPSKK